MHPARFRTLTIPRWSWALWTWHAEHPLPLTALGLLPVVLISPVLLAGVQVLAMGPHAPDVRAVFVHHLATALVRPPLCSVLTFGLRLASVALTLMVGTALWQIHPLLVIFALTPLQAQRQIGRAIRRKEEV